MDTLLEYRQCKFEVGAHLHTHGKHEGKWSPTFKIWHTPTGATYFMSGEDADATHPETKQEAEALATQQVKAWVDRHWDGYVRD